MQKQLNAPKKTAQPDQAKGRPVRVPNISAVMEAMETEKKVAEDQARKAKTFMSICCCGVIGCREGPFVEVEM